MIIEAILELIVGLFEAMLTLLGSMLPVAPGWWLEIGSAVDTVMASVGAPIRHFLPLQPLVTAGALLMTLQVTLGTLRLVRRAVSIFTGGGGA